MARSLKSNFAYNLIHKISELLFPMITFPYASRILLADGIGHVNFFNSIIQYIVMFASLGIPMYAIREIARIRGNEKERNKTTIEILLLFLFLAMLGYIAVGILSCTVAQVASDIPLFLILSVTIFFTAIGCDWFYQGIEDFKYVTLRGLLMRTLGVILLFVFVKDRSDIYWYALYLVFGVLGGNIFNFIRLRKYHLLADLKFQELRPFRHLKPALQVFALNLIISIYIQLNTVMLGFLSTETAVGLFTASSKLSHVMLGIGGALGNAMLPHMSNLVGEEDNKRFMQLSQKSMQFVVMVSLPITVGLMVLASSLIRMFCGDTYYEATLCLQLLAPIVLAIGMSNVTGYQILYPLGKINIVMLTTGIGAVANLLLNFILIPIFAQDGAAIATTVAETAVTVSMLYFGRRYFNFQFMSRKYMVYIVSTIIMGIAIYLCNGIFENPFTNTALVFSVGGLLYFICLIVFKDSLIKEILNKILHK